MKINEVWGSSEMISKLSKTFPIENPKDFLVFKNPSHSEIDVIFAGRLSALSKYIGKKIHILSGFRSKAEQEYLYSTCDLGFAARPGTSWHEYRLAIDTSDLWLKQLEKDEPTSKQIILTKFGLFKPLTKGNNKVHCEDWHIQPIETENQTSKNKWAPCIEHLFTRNLSLNDIGEDVKELQKQLNSVGYRLVTDGTFGMKTLKAVMDFQKNKNLSIDGIVGQQTWMKLFST